MMEDLQSQQGMWPLSGELTSETEMSRNELLLEYEVCRTMLPFVARHLEI